MKDSTVSKQIHTSSGHACGKLILIGEHAVVHGAPAIALPFQKLVTTAEITAGDGLTIDCKYYKGPLLEAPKMFQGLTASIYETLTRVNAPNDHLSIRLTSTVPVGKGLGSSASVAAATVRGLMSYYKKILPHEDLLFLIDIAEVFAHGTPSGIDAEAVTAHKPFWFVKGQPAEPIFIGSPLHFVVADCGQESDTHSAVEAVRKRLKSYPKKMDDSLNKIGELAFAVRTALSEGDLITLGTALNEAQIQLAAIGVSHPKLDRLIQAANRAGALGAKLTGGGCGGCILTLAKSESHARHLGLELRQAGANTVWVTGMNKEVNKDGNQREENRSY